eukprot:CAMPEP_0178376278 /NCGR_PEP_ID=MMETSP0689_2-20121128/3320_1 /TAXON_ID=160604 /ORGANISM="Amphidinium massartii, Strain CS-259" /LENGTH=109 /DNA_ID=CAMNT_0019996295 /DNA_START=26 /DNA_END=355 /DNA_ORIENTATION=-
MANVLYRVQASGPSCLCDLAKERFAVSAMLEAPLVGVDVQPLRYRVLVVIEDHCLAKVQPHSRTSLHVEPKSQVFHQFRVRVAMRDFYPRMSWKSGSLRFSPKYIDPMR